MKWGLTAFEPRSGDGDGVQLGSNYLGERFAELSAGGPRRAPR